MHWIRPLFIALVAAVFASPASAQPKKLALVIGNGAYAQASPLPNATRDAAVVSEALRDSGFNVDEAEDLKKGELMARITGFRQKVAAAGPGSIALLYYAGHGFELPTEAVLLAVDSRIETGRVHPGDAIPLGMLLDAASANPAGRAVVIIDACRDLLSFTQAGLTPSSFREPQRRPETYVVYSTSNDVAANDGEPGRNSPFAIAFLNEFRNASEPIEQFFNNVRDQVYKQTGQSQEPVDYSRLHGQIVLNDKSVSVARSLYYKAIAAYQDGDRTRYAQLLKQAAELDDPLAMITYGDARYYGVGVAADLSDAILWYHRAVDAGNSEGYLALGQTYRDRAEVRDYKQAALWFEKGVAANNRESMFNLAMMLQNDSRGIKNVPRAIELYKASLEAYNCCSAVNLAGLYFQGAEVPRDLALARKYATLASVRGNVKGTDILGAIELAEGNNAAARRTFELSASHGSPYGLLEQGRMYANGIGVHEDRAMARSFFEKGLQRATETNEAQYIEMARTYLAALDQSED
jgi:TPR repeat protein